MAAVGGEQVLHEVIAADGGEVGEGEDRFGGDGGSGYFDHGAERHRLFRRHAQLGEQLLMEAAGGGEFTGGRHHREQHARGPEFGRAYDCSQLSRELLGLA